MRPVILFVLFLVLIPGCGPGDRLKPGDEVIADGGKSAASIEFTSSDPNVKKVEQIDRALVSPGTKVRILNDDESASGKTPDVRPVLVKILEGEHAGFVGTVRRMDLSSPTK